MNAIEHHRLDHHRRVNAVEHHAVEHHGHGKMTAVEQHRKQRFLVNIAYWAVILALIYLVFKYLIHLVMPFFLALIFASVTRPVVRLLTRKLKLRGGIAAVLVTLLFFAVIGSLLILLSFRLISGVGNLFAMLPALYRDTLEPGLQNIFAQLEALAARFNLDIPSVLEDVGPQILSTVGNAVTGMSGAVVGWVSGLVAKIPAFLIGLVICIVATFFMSVDYERMITVLMNQLPNRAKEVAVGVRRSLGKVILQYGRSYVLILSITFVELAVGMLLLRVRHPVLIALLIAVLDIFPVLGTGTVLIPWTVISFIQGSIGRGFGLLTLYVAITVIRQIIEPRIVGKHVGLHPLITLVCMFVGSSLFGVLGLFGLPIMMAIVLELNNNGTIHLFRTGSAAAQPDEAPAAASPGGPAEEPPDKPLS